MNNRTLKSIAICHTCKGHGFTVHNEFRGHTEGWWPVEVVCKDCGGEGRVIRIVTIQYEQIKKGVDAQ